MAPFLSGVNTPAPTQRQVGTEIITMDGNDDLFEQCTEQFFLVAIGGGGCGPHTLEIGAKGLDASVVFGA